MKLQILNCDNCGACCMEMRTPPFIGDEYFSLPDDLFVEVIEAVQSDRPPESPCIWLDLETRQCRHYEHRPDICRDELECGDKACRAWRKEYKIQ